MRKWRVIKLTRRSSRGNNSHLQQSSSTPPQGNEFERSLNKHLKDLLWIVSSCLFISEPFASQSITMRHDAYKYWSNHITKHSSMPFLDEEWRQKGFTFYYSVVRVNRAMVRATISVMVRAREQPKEIQSAIQMKYKSISLVPNVCSEVLPKQIQMNTSRSTQLECESPEASTCYGEAPRGCFPTKGRENKQTMSSENSSVGTRKQIISRMLNNQINSKFHFNDWNAVLFTCFWMAVTC